MKKEFFKFVFLGAGSSVFTMRLVVNKYIIIYEILKRKKVRL